MRSSQTSAFKNSFLTFSQLLDLQISFPCSKYVLRTKSQQKVRFLSCFVSYLLRFLRFEVQTAHRVHARKDRTDRTQIIDHINSSFFPENQLSQTSYYRLARLILHVGPWNGYSSHFYRASCAAKLFTCTAKSLNRNNIWGGQWKYIEVS